MMTMEAQWRCGTMGMADKVSGEDSGRRAWWKISRTTGMDTEAEKMMDGNIRDLG